MHAMLSFTYFHGHPLSPTGARLLLLLVQVQDFDCSRLSPGELTRQRITGNRAPQSPFQLVDTVQDWYRYQ
jgi:hypothetical protein